MSKRQPPPAEKPAFITDFEERQFHARVQNEITLYRNTGDARFLWKAIALFHHAGKPLPSELVAKLAEWGGMVQTLSDSDEIAAALELRGDQKRHVGPQHSLAYRRRWRLASQVQLVHKLKGGALSEAFAIVARNRALTVAKVKAAYHDIFTAGTKRKPTDDLTRVLHGWR